MKIYLRHGVEAVEVLSQAQTLFPSGTTIPINNPSDAHWTGDSHAIVMNLLLVSRRYTIVK